MNSDRPRCFKALLLIGLVIIAIVTARASEALNTPWDVAALSRAPQYWPAEGFEEEGVRGLFFEGPSYHGAATRIFAWYGVPKDTTQQSFPAMVLVHGGGGTAFAEWVRLWTGRGYCAIALDTCGCIPRGTYGNWERHPHGGPAGWGGFDQIEAPMTEQWSYHAVSGILLAHSLLRSFPEVDAERTGITGISWGGYLTCIAAGVDSRFKLAVPVYGCGFLGENSAWLETFEGMGASKAAAWLARWDPSVYLPGASMPFLWVTGTNDFAYPMDSLQKSYRLPQGARTLCIRVRMPHGHGGAGENPEEIHAFANHVLRSGPPLPKIVAQAHEGERAWASFSTETGIAKAELVYTRDAGKWQDRFWESIPATVDHDLNRAVGIIPAGTKVYYLNLVTGDELVVSTEHETLE